MRTSRSIYLAAWHDFSLFYGWVIFRCIEDIGLSRPTWQHGRCTLSTSTLHWSMMAAGRCYWKPLAFFMEHQCCVKEQVIEKLWLFHAGDLADIFSEKWTQGKQIPGCVAKDTWELQQENWNLGKPVCTIVSLDVYNTESLFWWDWRVHEPMWFGGPLHTITDVSYWGDLHVFLSKNIVQRTHGANGPFQMLTWTNRRKFHRVGTCPLCRVQTPYRKPLGGKDAFVVSGNNLKDGVENTLAWKSYHTPLLFSRDLFVSGWIFFDRNNIWQQMECRNREENLAVFPRNHTFAKTSDMCKKTYGMCKKRTITPLLSLSFYLVVLVAQKRCHWC